MTDPALLLPMILAPSLAVMVFSGLVLAGVVVVRRLRLPQDLPEIPRFEPPPPTVLVVADPASARTIARKVAQQRGMVAGHLAIAHATVRDALACQEARLGLDGHPAVADAAHAASVALVRTATDSAVKAGEEADQIAQRLRARPEDLSAVSVLEDLRTRAQTARVQVDAAISTLPDVERRRRVWLLIIVLVVLLLWVVAMQALLRP